MHDEGQFVVFNDVPIFTEDEEYDSDYLEEVVANCNLRIENSGDYSPIVVGHSKGDGTPEHEQPEVIGFAGRFRTGLFGQTNPKKAIFTDLKIYKNKVDLVRRFPRRSVELWVKERIIDPISLLGPSTPKKDLGLLYQRAGRVLRYMKNDVDLTTYQSNAPGTIIQQGSVDSYADLCKQVIKYLDNLDYVQWCRTQMATQQREMEAYEDAEAEEEQAMAEQEKAQAPQSQPAQEAPNEQEAQDKVRMQRDQAMGELARFKQDYESLKVEFDSLKRSFRRSERERELVQLESEGIRFDRADELDLVTDMAPETFEKHKERMRKLYQRDITGVDRRINPTMYRVGESQELDMDGVLRAVELATEKGVSYEQALQSVRG